MSTSPANFFNPSSASSHRSCPPSSSPFSISSQFKKAVWGYRFHLLKVHCALPCNKPTVESESGSESEAKMTFLSPLSLKASPSSSTLVNKDAPFPLFGTLTNGLVTILGLQQDPKRTFGIEKINSEMVLIGTMTSVVAASAYILYTLSPECVGEPFSFFWASATLSLCLFFITLKNFGLEKFSEMVGSKLCVATLLFLALSASCYAAQPVLSSLAVMELPYVEKEVTKESTPLSLSLAKHLKSIGAKLYGAFWCSHCQHQKQIFGREATKLLDIIECYPDGLKEGTKIAKACSNINLQYLPSWEINGQVHGGVKQLEEIAELSGFKLGD